MSIEEILQKWEEYERQFPPKKRKQPYVPPDVREKLRRRRPVKECMVTCKECGATVKRTWKSVMPKYCSDECRRLSIARDYRERQKAEGKLSA